MAKVRFLQAAYIPSHGKVFNFNDELEMTDEKLVKALVKQDIIDVLKEEKVTKNTKTKEKSKKKVDEIEQDSAEIEAKEGE